MNYLVTFTPLEPYTFGTDQTFEYEHSGSKKTGKESYIAESTDTPEQTTILGTLRYMALLKAGMLKENGAYSSGEKEQIAEIIGPESFSFAKDDQSFGRIHSVSPLFLTDGSAVLIRNPFHNKAKDAFYSPMRLGEKSLQTSSGEVRLPAGSDQFNAKDGHTWGWIDLSSGAICNDLFTSGYVTGNRKKKDEKKQEDGFYRRKMIRLKAGYSLAVLVSAEENTFPEECVVFMGMKRAAFRARTLSAGMLFEDPERGEAAELLKEKTESFFNSGESWYYALSDLYVPEGFKPDTFAIIEEKNIRNLETSYEDKKERTILRRSSVRYNLIQAGSVFFDHIPEKINNSGKEKAGYNIICKLGGK